jgi:hypothetical protein
MTRLNGSSQPRQDTAHTPSNFLTDGEIAAAEARVREQEAHVLRLIVQGAPTQVAEDVLRQLTATALAMKERKRPARR